jgi:K+ transporter
VIWVYIGSTIVWLLSLIFAAVVTVKESDTLIINALAIIITTTMWVTVILNVGYPCWPPVAFALLVMIFAIELLLDLIMLV